MIKIKKIYKVNNGEVFLLKETDYKEHIHKMDCILRYKND